MKSHIDYTDTVKFHNNRALQNFRNASISGLSLEYINKILTSINI